MNLINNSLLAYYVRRARRASRWTPAALFAEGQQGVWYEPKPEYLYQDAAGTVPVTADGDPVGLMLDMSGNGNHAIQATSAARPTYRTDGVLHWLEGNGINAFIAVPASESMRWATVNAEAAEKVASYWGLRTRSMGTANGLSGFSLSSSGASPSNVGTFIRNDGEIERRIGASSASPSHGFGFETRNKTLLIKEFVLAGEGVEFFINNLSSGFISSSRQASSATPIELPWGILAMGNDTFHMDGDFFGGIFYEGGMREAVDKYMRSIMPPVGEL